jgi:small-conductance mechanosensitive channel
MNLTNEDFEEDGLFGWGFVDDNKEIDTFTFVAVVSLGLIACLELCIGHHFIRKCLASGQICCGSKGKTIVPSSKHFNTQLRIVLSKKLPKEIGRIVAVCILLTIVRIVSAHFHNDIIHEISHFMEQIFLVLTYYLCFRLTVSCIEGFEEVFEIRAKGTESKIDDMVAPLFSESLRLFVCVIWILQTLSMLGVDTLAATASVSVLALTVGAASQNYVQCLIGTLALIFDEPIAVGDRVVLAGQTGTIRGFTLRYCKLEGDDGNIIWVPSSAFLSGPFKIVRHGESKK